MLSFPQGLTTASLDQDLTTEICRFTTQIQVLFLSHYATVHIVGIYPRNYLMIQALEGNSVWGQGKEDFFFFWMLEYSPINADLKKMLSWAA